MRALVTVPDAPFGVAIREVPDPVPGPSEVLVGVAHSSLNYGDVSSARSADGSSPVVLGWDASGVVVAPAADGSGPPAGSPVLTFGYQGAWAERRVVSAGDAVVVPEKVDLGVAAALPVAGVTALRALRHSGSLLGRRVLVTGASGGVGRFAVQLAALGGAHVIAAAGRGAGLADLGAHEVASGPDGLAGLDPVDVVIENVGGGTLVRAWDLLAPGGVLQSIGGTSGEPSVFPPYSTVGPAKSLMAFQAGTNFAPDLAYLLELVAAGKLVVDVGWRGSWRQFDDGAQALFERRVTGKAVIDID